MPARSPRKEICNPVSLTIRGTMNSKFATGPVSRRTLLAAVAVSVIAANLVTKTASASETTPLYGRGYGGGY